MSTTEGFFHKREQPPPAGQDLFKKLKIQRFSEKIPAPDFELEDVDSKAVRLANFRGKNPVFLSFWASWCPACRQEAPEYEKLHQLLGPRGLKLVSISIDKGPGALSNVRKFMEEFKLSFSPLLDGKGEVLELYGVIAIPTTFLIDRKGKIVGKEIGPKKWTDPQFLNRLEGLFN